MDPPATGLRHERPDLLTTRVSSIDVARQVYPLYLEGSARPDEDNASIEWRLRSSTSSRGAEDDAGCESDDECVLDQSHGRL